MGSAPIDAAGVDGIASTEVVLSPPFVDPSSDLLHGDFNPVRIAHRGRRDDPVKNDNNDHDVAQLRLQQQKLQQQQPQQQKHADEYYDGVPVDCKLCNGRRDAIAIANNEPVLLCEQRGCNAEYHLGCLYECRPRLFQKRREDAEAEATTWNADANGDVDGDATSASDDDDDDDRVDAPASRVDNCVAGGVGTVPPSSTAGRLAIPAECHSMGAASVLAGYFDKVDFERSHFSCNRAYVTALLKKHMTENPDGNVVDSTDDEDGGSTAISRRRLKNMPRSELWYAHELHRLATTSSLRSTTAGRNDDGGARRSVRRRRSG